MDEIELVVRLATAADNARDREEDDLAELLDEAQAELEVALAMLQKVDTDQARAFIDRHSSPMPLTETAVHAKIWDQRLGYLIAAAKLMQGRDRAFSGEVLQALGLNGTQAAYEDADRAMRAGGYTRINGEYRRLHNDSFSG